MSGGQISVRRPGLPPRGYASSPRPEAAVQLAGASLRMTVVHDLHAIEDEWRRFEEVADCTVFQSFDWLSSWQDHVGSITGVRPAIVTGRQGSGQPLFILPLATHRAGLAARLTFLGGDLCDYNAPLLAPEFARTAVDNFRALWKGARSLIKQSAPYDVILLHKMPERIGDQPNPFLRLGVRSNPSSAYLTALSGNWDSFYAAKRSAPTRQRDRNKRRRLANGGPLRTVTVQDPQARADTLERLLSQKQRSLARMGAANVFDRPGYRAFFFALVTSPQTRKLVHVGRLEAGDRIAAANLGLEFRGRYYHVLASHDDGPLSRFGPGAAHLHDLMRYALDRGLDFFDFTIGDEPYKRDWSDTELRLYDHIAAASPSGWIAATLQAGKRRAKRAIKRSPLAPALLRLRARLLRRKTRAQG